VTYIGFEAFPAARAAFQEAVDIWASTVASPVPIRVRAEFRALGANILGSAGALSVWKDFPGAPVPGAYYGDALADRLRGADNQPGQFDITALFNSTFANWYFGVDGATPAGQYDFVSVVLHELGHGLGFFGSAAVASGNGSIGISGTPTIYDFFTMAESGSQLLTFANPSQTLGTQLTSGYNPWTPQGRGVYWGGSRAVSGNNGLAPRHFTPTTWTGGSSYSHLDDSVYAAGDPNSLMTHALGAAEAIHDPGPITTGLLADMGWQVNSLAQGSGRDFDQDGQQDFLFEHASGQRYVWLMNGITLKGDTSLSPAPMSPTVATVGVNDFTGDGRPDLLMEDTADARLWVYRMNGYTKVAEQALLSGANLPWRVMATADFNGDDKADILFQNFDTGELYVWFMSSFNNQAIFAGPNGAFAGGYVLANPSQLLVVNSSAERVIAAADMNGDGAPDLLIRHMTSGAIRVAYLNGITRIGDATINPTAPPLWRVAAVGDYNGDGQTDLVWQHDNTGQLYAWFLNGVTIAYDGPPSPSNIGTAWKLVGPR
jgi:hypothetical protein